jgi:hypothetical protein
MGDNAKFDPRRELFRKAYMNPKSKTFSNAYKSALVAGYTEEYAKNITGQGNAWFSEIIRDQKRRLQVDKNIDKFLTNDADDGLPLKLKADMTKFVAKHMMSDKYGDSLKLTDADGGSLNLGSLFGSNEQKEKSIIDADFEDIADDDLGLLTLDDDELFG